MNRCEWLVLMAAVSLMLPPAALSAETMKPGLWEITTAMEMPGMPFQPPAQTVRHCYTPQDVREQPVPKDDQCRVTDLKSTGSKVSWKVECTGEMAGKGEGEISYQGDSACEGKSRMQTQGMAVSMKYKGKRLGDCQ